MSRYLKIARSVPDTRWQTESANNVPEPLASRNATSSVPDAEENAHQRLREAGWKSKRRCGLTIWQRPTSGFFYSQEMAVYFLDECGEQV